MAQLLVTGTDAQGNRGSVAIEVVKDGDADQTTLLQSVIDAAPDGTPANPSVVALPAGRFRAEGTLKIHRRAGLIVDMTRTELFRLGRGLYEDWHITIMGSSDVTLLGGRVEGAHVEYDLNGIQGSYVPAFAAQHGIRIGTFGSTGTTFTPCTNIVVDGFSARDIGGDFIYISGSLVGPQGNRYYVIPEGVTIRNVLGEKNGRQGIGVVGVRGLVVEDSTIIAKRTAIDLENVSITSAIEDVVISRNLCLGDNGLVNGQSSHPSVNNILIEDNAYRGGGGIRCSGQHNAFRHDWTVRGNIWPADAYTINPGHWEGAPFWFNYITGVVFENNYMRVGLKRTHQRETNAVFRLCHSDDMQIVGNDFKGFNQLILEGKPSQYAPLGADCVSANLTATGNTGIWEGPISSFQPYPTEHDPNVDKVWLISDFPQLTPTPFATAGYWDGLPRGRQ